MGNVKPENEILIWTDLNVYMGRQDRTDYNTNMAVTGSGTNVPHISRHYCYRQLTVSIVASAIAVFRLVDNIMPSHLQISKIGCEDWTSYLRIECSDFRVLRSPRDTFLSICLAISTGASAMPLAWLFPGLPVSCTNWHFRAIFSELGGCELWTIVIDQSLRYAVPTEIVLQLSYDGFRICVRQVVQLEETTVIISCYQIVPPRSRKQVWSYFLSGEVVALVLRLKPGNMLVGRHHICCTHATNVST